MLLCLFVFSRLYTQSHKRFKISEEKVAEHIHALGLFEQTDMETLRENGEDPYDFKEGDIEYPFPSSKRLKGSGRETKQKAKVGEESFKKKNTIIKDSKPPPCEATESIYLQFLRVEN